VRLDGRWGQLWTVAGVTFAVCGAAVLFVAQGRFGRSPVVTKLAGRSAVHLAEVVEVTPVVCAGKHDNCWESKCCANPTEACYAKDLGWAQCRESCTPGVDGSEDQEFRSWWSCTLVGERRAPPTSSTPPAPRQCSREKENCIPSKCCSDPAKQCFMKDPGWAECKESCTPGVDSSEAESLQTPWSCKLAEEELSTTTLAATAAPAVDTIAGGAGPSLFCFTLMQPAGFEVALMKSQLFKGAGVFSCNMYTVYSNSSVELSPGPPVPINTEAVKGPVACRYGGAQHAPLNTEVFVRVWQQVFKDGKYQDYDWTVKVDPDTVFLPKLLRQHVGRYLDLSISSPDERVYFGNCKAGLHGAIEVLSRGAMWFLSAGIHRCVHGLKGDFGQYGEDEFLRRCLDIVGVRLMEDFGMLKDPSCAPVPAQPAPCINGKVAFHPLRTPAAYFDCLAQAEGLSSSH